MPIYQMGGILPPILMEKLITSITLTRKQRGLIPETGKSSDLFANKKKKQKQNAICNRNSNDRRTSSIVAN